MDSSNSTVVDCERVPGVRFTEHPYSNEYVGSAEALIAAGIVRAEQLPGQPGTAKTMATFYAGQLVPAGKRASQQDENWMRVHRMGKKFSVLLGLTAEVQATRKTVYEAESKARRKEWERVQSQRFLEKMQAENTLNLMVNSPGEYRQKVIKKLQEDVRYLCRRDVLPNDNHGFSLSESVAAELEDLLDKMTDLVADAQVQFDARRHRMINHQCRITLAKVDGGFQRALEGMIHGTK